MRFLQTFVDAIVGRVFGRAIQVADEKAASEARQMQMDVIADEAVTEQATLNTLKALDPDVQNRALQRLQTVGTSAAVMDVPLLASYTPSTPPLLPAPSTETTPEPEPEPVDEPKPDPVAAGQAWAAIDTSKWSVGQKSYWSRLRNKAVPMGRMPSPQELGQAETWDAEAASRKRNSKKKASKRQNKRR